MCVCCVLYMSSVYEIVNGIMIGEDGECDRGHALNNYS